MNTIVQNYGKKSLPNAYRFRTVQELNELLDNKSLTSEDLKYLYYMREIYYGFRCNRINFNTIASTHRIEPSTLIFLDIKGTLYDGGTHGSGIELLARSPLDSKPITYDEVDAIGDIIACTKPQDLRISYRLNNKYSFVPTQNACTEFLVERDTSHDMKMKFKHPKCERPKYSTKYGPFTVVFISSDTVETQKNIIALLYYMSLFIDKILCCGVIVQKILVKEKEEIERKIREYALTGKDIDVMLAQLDMSVEGIIKRIERDLLKYNNDFMKFLEYENKNYANLDLYEIAEFKKTIDGLFFLSTSETGKTKGQLMEEFIESSTRKNRVGSNYSLFAFGDSYSTDGEMLLNAYQYGGLGLIRGGNNCYSYGGCVELTRDLAEKGIQLPYFPIANSVAEFYNMIMRSLVYTRENELIQAMTYANYGVEGNALESLNFPACIRKQ